MPLTTLPVNNDATTEVGSLVFKEGDAGSLIAISEVVFGGVELSDSNRLPVESSLPIGAASEATQDEIVAELEAILAKLITAPATEAKQDTANTTLASILAKLIAAPSTESKQDTGNTTLANILAKLIVAPATEAKQDSGIAVLEDINNKTLLPETYDYDTGAGTDNVPVVGILLPTNGGAVPGGTASAPLRTDPTGSTIQPVSGSVSITGTPGVTISGNVSTTATDGSNVALGATTDAEAAGNGTLIALIKRLRTLLNGGLPAALAASGGLKIEGVAGGVVVPVADGGGSLTVDAAVASPVSVRISNGVGNVDTIPVSLASVPSHAVTNGGTFVVQENGAALTALQLIDNLPLVDDAPFTPGTSSVVGSGFVADETSTDSVDEGDAGIARMTLDRKQITAEYAHTAGGATPYSYLASAAANQDSAIVKGTPGQLHNAIVAFNLNAAARYLKLYNKATGPTSADIPVQRLLIPGNTAGAGFSIPLPKAMEFTAGISLRITTGIADNDANAVAANEVVVNLSYK